MMDILKLTKITALTIALLVPFSVQATSNISQAELVTLMANADAKVGRKLAKSCLSCHVEKKGKKHGHGTNLYNIINSIMGSAEGFKYSKAFKALKAEEKRWGYEELFAFLRKPSSYIKGNKMSYKGIKSKEKRADIIAYLRTLSENPAPLPK